MRVGRLRAIFVLALGALVSCASPPAPESPLGPSAAPEHGSAASNTTTSASAEDWHCGGDLVPPSDWQQDTAFASGASPNARGQASTDATSKLAKRLCASSGGNDCDYLTAHIRLWKTGSNGRDVCAMAVIRSDDLLAWRNLSSTLATLDDKLGSAASELLHGVAPTKRVAIDRIIDMGVPGGQRADWLRTRMERFLGQKAILVDAPRKWAGDGVPPGVDVVVRCEVVARSEQGVATLESSWFARFPDGRKVRSSAVAFPEQASPHSPTETPPTIPDSAGLNVRLDSGRGGSLCAGERTQIWLKSDAPVYVRVFDLYGAGDAMVTYPNPDQPSARIEPGQSIPLGGKLGFEATPIPGSEAERFLVIAAPTEQALGRFAGAKGDCRVEHDLARQLFAGSGMPRGIKIATAGYRITSASGCAAQGSPREGVVDAISALPVCQF